MLGLEKIAWEKGKKRGTISNRNFSSNVAQTFCRSLKGP